METIYGTERAQIRKAEVRGVRRGNAGQCARGALPEMPAETGHGNAARDWADGHDRDPAIAGAIARSTSNRRAVGTLYHYSAAGRGRDGGRLRGGGPRKRAARGAQSSESYARYTRGARAVLPRRPAGGFD